MASNSLTGCVFFVISRMLLVAINPVIHNQKLFAVNTNQPPINRQKSTTGAPPLAQEAASGGFKMVRPSDPVSCELASICNEQWETAS